MTKPHSRQLLTWLRYELGECKMKLIVYVRNYTLYHDDLRGSGRIHPHILNLKSRQRQLAIGYFTFPRGRVPSAQYKGDWRGVLKPVWMVWRREGSIALAGNWTLISRSLSPQPVTIPHEDSWLLTWRTEYLLHADSSFHSSGMLGQQKHPTDTTDVMLPQCNLACWGRFWTHYIKC
jgi:hypothetical protein